MTKINLERFINTCHNNFCLIALGATLIVSKEVHNVTRVAEVNFGRFNVKFDQILNQDPEKLSEAIYELTKLEYRTLIIESFERIKAYSNETNQFDKMNKAYWYQFARSIRNAFNHDFHLNFKEKDRKFFPLKWNNKANPSKEIQIEFNMNGWPVDIVNRPFHKDRSYLQFTYEDAIDLYDDMKIFVLKELI
jgi:hypothetical protein